MFTFRRPAWGLGLALLVGCAPAPTKARVADGFVVAEQLDLPAPSLPALCTSVPSSPQRWVFFSSQRCAYCRAMREALADSQPHWSARGVAVVELVVDVGSCERALGLSDPLLALPVERRPWAVGLADPQTVHAWGVEQTPLLVMVHDDQARALFVGQTPVAALLAAHDRIAQQATP